MNWTVVPLDAAAPQAWKNGGGATRELLAWPTPQDWRVRLSVADVTRAGPFSPYPGIERWFSVLEGAGVRLQVGPVRQVLLAEHEPFRFDGGTPVDCELLDGPTRDFNLMAAPGQGRMRRLDGEKMFRMRGPGLLALYAHGQPARVVLDWKIQEVPPFHLAWCLRPEASQGIARGQGALLIEVLA
jgi:environmental stress-induced protein Ves